MACVIAWCDVGECSASRTGFFREQDVRMPLMISPDGPWEVMGERTLFAQGKKKRPYKLT